MAKFIGLEDASMIQLEAEYTFYRPSRTVMQQLKVGNLVKLIFNLKPEATELRQDRMPSAERMWVIITERKGDNFKGTLDNDPYFIKNLKHKDIIEFETKHIIQTDIEETENDIVEKYARFCIVSNMILKERKPIGYFCRDEEESTMENGRKDSGWVFMSGEESDEYANNPDNLTFTTLGIVLNINDSFIDLLDEPVGSAFTWDEILKKYVKTE